MTGVGDLTTWSPVEVDTMLADLYNEAGRIMAEADRAINRIYGIADMVRPGEKTYRFEKRQPGTLDEALAVVEALAEGPSAYDRQRAEAALRNLAEVREQGRANRKAQDPLHAEYRRRGGWTRAYLVTNNGGHVHSSMHCSTCYPTTWFSWLPTYSGGTEQTIVEDAGERACTVCYPSAPVEVLSRPTRIFSDDERTAQAARAARAAAKAERDAANAAKAIANPDGSPLKGSLGFRIDTERTAQIEATDVALRILTDRNSREGYVAEQRVVLDRLLTALAHKRGTPVEEQAALIDGKARQKAKREGWNLC